RDLPRRSIRAAAAAADAAVRRFAGRLPRWREIPRWFGRAPRRVPVNTAERSTAGSDRETRSTRNRGAEQSLRRGLHQPRSHRCPGLAAHFVSHTADRVNEMGYVFTIHLLAQVVDINIDDVGGGIERQVPHVLHDHGTGDEI